MAERMPFLIVAAVKPMCWASSAFTSSAVKRSRERSATDCRESEAVPGEGSGALEIDEKPCFQRRQLLVARAAVVVFVVVIALGLLGLFGSGPFSYATAGQPGDPVSVEYQRFLRFGAATEVEVRLREGEGTTRVAFAQSYLDDFDFGGVLPEADAESAVGGWLVFTFEEEPPSRVTVSLTPQKVGLRDAKVSVGGRPAVSFRQLVYP
jgi:hypothetical protein